MKLSLLTGSQARLLLVAALIVLVGAKLRPDTVRNAGVARPLPQESIRSGDAYQDAGDLPAAIAAWEAGRSGCEQCEALLERLWPGYLSLGNYSLAAKRLEDLIRLRPGEAGLYYRAGLILAATQPERALSYLAQAAALDTSLSAPVESVQKAVQSARHADNPAYTLLSSGRALAALDEWDLAREAFHQATRARPDWAEAWAYLGEARQHAPATGAPGMTEPQQNRQALEELQQAISLDGESLAAHTFLSLYWTRQGDYPAARQALETAIALDPKNPVLQVELGRVLALGGDLQEAAGAYAFAVRLTPGNPAYLRHLVTFSLEYEFDIQGTGLQAARQALRLNPDDPASLDTMGQVLIRLNDLYSAERFLQRALAVDPNYAAAHLHLGLVYVLLGRPEAGRDQLLLANDLAKTGAAADQAQRLLKTYFPTQ